VKEFVVSAVVEESPDAGVQAVVRPAAQSNPAKIAQKRRERIDSFMALSSFLFVIRRCFAHKWIVHFVMFVL